MYDPEVSDEEGFPVNAGFGIVREENCQEGDVEVSGNEGISYPNSNFSLQGVII